MSIVRSKRDAAKLTLEQLAQKANIGIYRLARIERGQPLSLDDAIALAGAFQCDPTDFYEGERLTTDNEHLPAEEPTRA